MNIKKHPALRLLLPSDLFLPTAFLAACLLGRGAAALGLFVAWYASKLCALATSDALRAAFATQPSTKYVQGSGLVSLGCQLPGAALSALILYLIPDTRLLLPMVPCGLFLNIEHVFYEYLCAVGDRKRAFACRCLTAVLVLLGLILCMPSQPDLVPLSAVNPGCLLITCGLSVLIGLFISLSLGGKLQPVPNPEVLRRAPLSMLHAGLYPALVLPALTLLWPGRFTPTPLFAGLLLYEACRTPFRRSPLESRPMNRLLLVVGAAALICLVVFQFLLKTSLSEPIAMTGAALLIAALCAFGLFGSLTHRE